MTWRHPPDLQDGPIAGTVLTPARHVRVGDRRVTRNGERVPVTGVRLTDHGTTVVLEFDAGRISVWRDCMIRLENDR